MTDAESLIWKLLRGRRLAYAKFRRQHPLGRYIFDFCCRDQLRCIERDGAQYIQQEEYDLARAAWLRRQGIVCLRFWNNDVLSETESVMEVIYSVLKADKNPSPACGRGEHGSAKR